MWAPLVRIPASLLPPISRRATSVRRAGSVTRRNAAGASLTACSRHKKSSTAREMGALMRERGEVIRQRAGAMKVMGEE